MSTLEKTKLQAVGMSRNIDQQADGRNNPFLTKGAVPGSHTRQSTEGEYVLSVGDLFKVMWRRLWVIALTALALAAVAVGYSFFWQTPEYEATVKVLVEQRQDADGPAPSLSGEVQGLQDLVFTVVEAVESRSVADAVIQRLDLSTTSNEFLADLRVEEVPTTQFIEISYRDPSPERAGQVTNAAGEEASSRVSRVSSAITATVWDRAVIPQEPVSPQPLRNGLVALVLGALLGTGLAFLLEHLDDSWRSPEEIEQVSGVPTFGVIPAFSPPKTKNKARG